MGGVSHAEWRRTAKKYRRKRIRQQRAKQRDQQIDTKQRKKEQTLEYQIWKADQERMETFRITEEERICEEQEEKWLRTELLAQQQWRQLQEKIAKSRLERAEQDLRIKKEWEEEQRKVREAEEIRKQLELEKVQQHQELMRRIELFVSGDGELPPELLVGRETNPGKEQCPFFSKTAACRFADNCSRNHKYPGISKVLLASNFYSNFVMEHSRQNEHGDDIPLESDDREMYSHFEEFFNDVLPEFQKFGNVVQFKVCLNYERHLRGNTYVEFSSLPESLNAYRTFHGRWYGGKQVSLQFCEIPSWKRAICGMFAARKCPKGKSCNFLHVFDNPRNMFKILDQRSVRSEYGDRRTRSKHRNRDENWRWSESPVREIKNNRRDSKDDSRAPSHSSSHSERRNRSNRSTSRRGHSRDRSEISRNYSKDRNYVHIGKNKSGNDLRNKCNSKSKSPSSDKIYSKKKSKRRKSHFKTSSPRSSHSKDRSRNRNSYRNGSVGDICYSIDKSRSRSKSIDRRHYSSDESVSSNKSKENKRNAKNGDLSCVKLKLADNEDLKDRKTKSKNSKRDSSDRRKTLNNNVEES